MVGKVVSLFGGPDPRLEALTQAVLDLLYDRGAGMPVPSVVGVLEIVKDKIIKEHSP